MITSGPNDLNSYPEYTNRIHLRNLMFEESVGLAMEQSKCVHYTFPGHEGLLRFSALQLSYLELTTHLKLGKSLIVALERLYHCNSMSSTIP